MEVNFDDGLTLLQVHSLRFGREQVREFESRLASVQR
jgi:hypothetical protein